MAVSTSMPPQAYTRDTLVKAIDWISRQPSAVKERASSADLMVSFYLQACRRSEMQMEAPVSGETFREDLKHLAQDLKQFEEPFAPPPLIEHTVRREPPAAPVTRLFQTAPEPAPVYAPPPVYAAPAPQPGPKAFTWQPDARTLAMARDIQQRLNLGSESEGLRLLVTLGSERARELFPQ